MAIKECKKTVGSNFIKNRTEQTKTTIDRKKKRKQEKTAKRTKNKMIRRTNQPTN